MAEKKRVGFIGVGYMGHGMAKNLVEKGHPLVIKGNRNRQPVEDLVGRGAKEMATPTTWTSRGGTSRPLPCGRRNQLRM